MTSALHYYMHDSSTEFRFKLSGELSGDGVRDLQQAWQTASSTVGKKRFIVDVGFVTAVDGEGHALLERWHAVGARLIVTSAAAKKRIESMIRQPVTLFGKQTGRWLPAVGRAIISATARLCAASVGLPSK